MHQPIIRTVLSIPCCVTRKYGTHIFDFEAAIVMCRWLLKLYIIDSIYLAMHPLTIPASLNINNRYPVFPIRTGCYHSHIKPIYCIQYIIQQ